MIIDFFYRDKEWLVGTVNWDQENIYIMKFS